MLEHELAFDIGPARVHVLRRAFSENSRRAIAMGIAEHLKLCGWHFEHDPRPRSSHPGDGPAMAALGFPNVLALGVTVV